MKRSMRKFVTICLMLSLVLGAGSVRGYTNVYGDKKYTKTKTGDICEMTAEGKEGRAYTSVTNTANSKRYYSAYVNRRNAKTDYTYDSKTEELLLNSGSTISVFVNRYPNKDNRKHEHKAISWNCSMEPSGTGWSNFKDDELTYTVIQTAS